MILVEFLQIIWEWVKLNSEIFIPIATVVIAVVLFLPFAYVFFRIIKHKREIIKQNEEKLRSIQEEIAERERLAREAENQAKAIGEIGRIPKK